MVYLLILNMEVVMDGFSIAEGIAKALPFAIVVFIYFIPSISAKMRKHPKTEAILALNLLLGWTILGWIGALIWAMNEPVKKTT
jgi:uncharacterized membrane protein YqaE (UPF0057 family)